jgi:hypothetical protein
MRDFLHKVRFPLSILFFCLAFLFVPAFPLYAIDIDATGSWELVIDASDLAGVAGSDLKGDYQSERGATVLDITGTAGSDDVWRVRVRVGSPLPWDVKLYARRTGDGDGSGAITNGTSYVEVTASGIDFFNGSGDRTAVSIQYKLSGISISISPGAYSPEIIFTVVNI